jgi:hypothetical protein
MPRTRTTQTREPAAPSREPPEVTSTETDNGGAEARPADPTEAQLAVLAATPAAQATPTAEPPPEAIGVEAVGVWQSNKRLNMLWSINQNRNSWIGVQGIGWKKLSNASDSSIVAMTAFAAHARDAQAPVYYREEADGMVHEIYVW